MAQHGNFEVRTVAPMKGFWLDSLVFTGSTVDPSKIWWPAWDRPFPLQKQANPAKVLHGRHRATFEMIMSRQWSAAVSNCTDSLVFAMKNERF